MDKQRRKGGRPRKYEPNQEDRALVIALASMGFSVEDIRNSLKVEVCAETIRLHYAREIRTARNLTMARIGQKLQQIALDGKGDVNAINSWLNWFGRKPVREQEDSGKESLADLLRELDE